VNIVGAVAEYIIRIAEWINGFDSIYDSLVANHIDILLGAIMTEFLWI